MAEYASFYINAYNIDSYRNSVGYGVWLFAERDRKESDQPYFVEIGDVEKLEESQPEDGNTESHDYELRGYRYEVTAAEMIDRLEVMGYTLASVQEAFEEGIAALREQREGYDFIPAEETARLFDGFTFDKWTELMAQILRDKLPFAFPNTDESRTLQRDDPQLHYMLERFSVSDHLFGFPTEDYFATYRAILSVVDQSAPVVLDYSNLVNWVESDAYECAPPKTIILTEGSSDKWVLERTLELLYPHLFDYFSFLNFEAVNMQGSAGQLLNVVRAFLGTGISNPIIALFDNDTAGRDALRLLSKLSFPKSMKAMALPDLELAGNYPTIGPQGEVEMNINGLACSIEIYFGRQMLSDPSGILTRVQWTGYNPGMKQYQGEILDKPRIQENFRRILEDIASGKSRVEDHDWSGIRCIFEAIFTALH